MGLDTEFWNVSWIVGLPWLGLLTLAYFIWKRRAKPPAAAPQFPLPADCRPS